jgi:hypothetical protein
MAVVMIGGMLTSTLLTLLFVPALYAGFNDIQSAPGRLREWRARRRERQAPVGAPAPVPATAPAPGPALADAGGD